jgi:hypothetical protein
VPHKTFARRRSSVLRRLSTLFPVLHPVADQIMLQASFDNVVLLATLPTLDAPRFLLPAIANAARCARQRLVIVLYSRLFNARRPHPDSTTGAPRPAALWADVQRVLTYVYAQATSVAHELDRALFSVDVLLKGLDEDLPAGLGEGMEIAFRIEGGALPSHRCLAFAVYDPMRAPQTASPRPCPPRSLGCARRGARTVPSTATTRRRRPRRAAARPRKLRQPRTALSRSAARSTTCTRATRSCLAWRRGSRTRS